MDATATIQYAPSMGIDFVEIKRRREAAGLTLQQAADSAGFAARQYWWQIENGKKPGLSVDSLAAVARVLGCKLDDLIEKPAKKRKSPKN
jgi:transcriptional regulator with XRE-family HTH domain